MGLVPILAIGAALLGAPSPASAAGNALTNATASPSSVAPGGLVHLSVTYDGKSPAVAVSAEIAGLTFPLVRQAGTSRSGTWAAAVTLPVGSWTVVFRATTTHGKSPTVTGPSISVGAVAPTITPSASRGQVPDRSGTKPTASSPGTPPPPAPPAAPAPSSPSSGEVDDGGTHPSAPDEAPADEPGEAPPTHARPGGGGPSAPVAPPSGASTAAEPRFDEPGESGSGAPAAPSPGAGAGMPGSDAAGDDAPIGVGLVGIAAIAAVGAGFLAAGRARRRAEDELMPVAEEVAEVLDRRTLRQGKVRLESDPIVAALGIDEDIPADRSASRDSG